MATSTGPKIATSEIKLASTWPLNGYRWPLTGDKMATAGLQLASK